MPQLSINDFFTVATPEQIAQQNQLAWAKLHNRNQAMLALQNIKTEQKAIRTIEKQRSDNARRSREYRARLKAARKPITKQVCPYLLLLLFLLLLPFLMTVTLLQKPKLRPPLLSSDLLLPSRNTMQIPLKRASKKQIEAGTAPPRVRAPPHQTPISASETQAATNVSDESYDCSSDIEDIDMIDVDAISDSEFSI